MSPLWFIIGVWIMGIIYLLTVARFTDIIPFIGLADDIIVILIMFISLLLYLLPGYLDFLWANYKNLIIIGGVILIIYGWRKTYD